MTAANLVIASLLACSRKVARASWNGSSLNLDVGMETAEPGTTHRLLVCSSHSVHLYHLQSHCSAPVAASIFSAVADASKASKTTQGSFAVLDGLAVKRNNQRLNLPNLMVYE